MLQKKIIIVSNDEEIYKCVQKAILDAKHNIQVYRINERRLPNHLEERSVISVNLKRRRSDNR